MKRNKFILICGCIVLPIISIYLGSKSSLYYENLTYVGNLKEYHTLFIIWGIANSLYYCYAYLQLCNHLNYHNKTYQLLCIACTLISIIAFCLPYKNHSGDIFSQFHVYGALSSCILTIILLTKTLLKHQFIYPNYFNYFKNTMISLCFVCIIIFTIFGDISTLLELIILNGLNYIFYRLLTLSKE